MANGLKCTDMCRLQDCENQASINQEDEEVESVQDCENQASINQEDEEVESEDETDIE